MSSPRESFSPGDNSYGGLEVVGSSLMPEQTAQEGISRLHLVQLEEGASCTISPDYSQMSRERVMEELAKLNLEVAKGNFWSPR